MPQKKLWISSTLMNLKSRSTKTCYKHGVQAEGSAKCMQKVAATSGNKQKLLRRLKKYKHQEEERLAREVAQKLLSEQRREAIPIQLLPTQHEQELHCLTHLPCAPWCQACVSNRGREDARLDEERSDRKTEDAT